MPSSAGKTCALDRKSTRLNSSHTIISYAVFCLKKNNDRIHLPPLGSFQRRGRSALFSGRGPRRVRLDAERGRASLVYARVTRAHFFFLKDPPPPDFSPFPLPAAFPV